MDKPVDPIESVLVDPKAREEFERGLADLDRKLGLPADDPNEFVLLPENAWGIVGGSNGSNWRVVHKV